MTQETKPDGSTEKQEETPPVQLEVVQPTTEIPPTIPVQVPARTSKGPSRAQRDAALAATVPESGEVPVPDAGAGVYIKARNRLGLSKKRWALPTVRAAQEFGKFMGVKLTASVQLVMTIDSQEQVQKVFEVAGKMAEDTSLPPDIRVKALAMITEAGKVGVQISEQVMKLAAASAEKEESDKSKGKNAPPAFGAEFESNGEGKTVARVFASNGQQT